MPKPRALTVGQARHSLANRLGARVVDRVRQFATNLGIRPYRVALVWTTWTGTERGEGQEREFARVEILPTPEVISLDAVAMSPQAAGMLPMGSVRVQKISITNTLDRLKGKSFPTPHEKHIPDNIGFYYEVKEDGRGDFEPEIARFRLASEPFRKAGNMEWVVNLERIDTLAEK
jgi:hypothetical protein